MKKSYRKIVLLLFLFQFVFGIHTASAGWFSKFVKSVENAVHVVVAVVTDYCGTWTQGTVVTVNNTQGNITVCNGASVRLNITGDKFDIANSNTFKWVAGSGAVVSPNKSFSSGNRSFSVVVNATTTFICYGLHPGCNTQAYLGQVTVYVDNPQMSFTSTVITITSGQTVNTNFGKTNTLYKWTLPTYTRGALAALTVNINGSSVFQQTFVNNTNSSQQATYTITPIDASTHCSGTPFTVIVDVSPVPHIQNISQTLCGGNTFTVSPVNGPLNIVPANTKYSWGAPTLPSGLTGGSSSNGYQASIIQTLSNTTNSVLTATYTVTPSIVVTKTINTHFGFFGSPHYVTETIVETQGTPFIVVVNVAPNAPSLSVTPNTTVCFGDNTTLTATGASNYAWSTGAHTNSIIVNPASGTASYTVTASNLLSCLTTKTVSVTVLSIQAGPNQAICMGGEAILQASGGSNYAWYPEQGLNNTSIPNPVASPQVTTTYTVLAPCGSNQLLSAQVTVTVNPNPNLALANSSYVICSGQSVQLNTTGSGTYKWTPTTGLSGTTSSSPTASPSVSTNYKVILTDNSTGCGDSANVDVIVNSIAVIPARNNITIENGDTAQLHVETIGGNGTTISWVPVLNLNTAIGKSVVASPTTTTTYTVSTQSNGCVDQTEIIVDVLNKPTAAFVYSVCGEDVKFTTNNSGSSYSYFWNFGDGNTSTTAATPETPLQHNYSAQGYYNVCLTVSDQFSQAKYCNQVYVQPVTQ